MSGPIRTGAIREPEPTVEKRVIEITVTDGVGGHIGQMPDLRSQRYGRIPAVRDCMGDDAFDVAARDGSALSWDAALNEAKAICQGIEEPSVAQLRRAPGRVSSSSWGR